MKKILTVFLAFLLILTMLPAGGAVYAEDSGGCSGGGGIDVSNVTGITIESQPKLVYAAGEQLDLMPIYNDHWEIIHEGLLVTLHFSDREPLGPMDFSDFEYAAGGAADPANGTELTAAHNGQQIKLTCNGIEVLTDPLVVTSEAEGADIIPATADFDKKSANQADVRIEVQWWNSVQTISGVKSGDSYLVSGEDYDFSGDSTNGYFLTIKKEYLAKQPEGPLVLTVEFSLGSSAQLTINIADTGDVNPPSWPEGSTLTASSVTSESAHLSWSAASDDLAVTSYRIYQNDTLIQTVAGNVTTCELTGLSAETEYTFRVEAGDSKGQWTTGGPSVTIKTAASTALTGLSLKAPRYTLEGHLFMGDTVSIEMVSNQSGLSPEVTVAYKEWNVDRTATEDKTSKLTLAETSSGSKTYAANFTLSAGICEVTTLAGKLKPDSSPYEVVVNYRVAGRIKLTVQAPAGLDSDQMGIYNDFLQNTFAVAYKTNSWVSFTSEIKDPEKPNEFTIEGVFGNDNFQAATYELKHYKEFLIYENDGTVPVIDGQESVCQYSIDSFSHLKVRVVDEATGEPIENALVRSPQLIYVNGMRDYNLSALTGSDGYAATSGAYFAQNLMRDQELELSAYSVYESKKEVVAAGSLAVGENPIEIRLKKVPVVTLQGTVTGATDKTLEQVLVRVPQTALDGTDISATTLTKKDGFYTLQVPKTAKTVSFSKFGTNIDKPLALVDGKNTLDVQFPPITARVKVFVETKDIYGNITQLDSSWRVNAHLHISGKNLTNNNTGLMSNGNCTIEGEPGDEIEVNVDGSEGGFGQATKRVVLDENNYAEARVVLTPSAQQPKIHVRVVDQNSTPRLGETRYMFLFNEDGRLVSRVDSTAPEISYAVLPGLYRVAFSWQGTISSDYLADWENGTNCLIYDRFFEVKVGKDTYLGEIPLNYSEADPYFIQNTAASVTCSQRAAIPGSVVTLRVGYDYDNRKAIDGGKLDLVAQIPADAELVEGSVLHRSTRGNAGSAEPVISGNKVILDLKDHIQGAAGVLTYQVRLKSPAVFNSISAGAELKFTAGGSPVSENIGFVEIPCRFITINAPLEVTETAKSDPVTLSGLASSNETVELYDGDVKIGETQAAPSGVWAMNVILPDSGTPIYHRLMASIVVDDLPYIAEAAVLVGSKGTEITDFVMRQGDTSVRIKPKHNFIEFPLVITPGQGDSVISISFKDNNKVSNVKIAGEDAIFHDGLFQARVPYTTPLITVEYDEEAAQPEEILRHDFGIAPEYLREAEVEFTDSNHTAADTRVGYGADGYLSEFLLPEVQISARDGDKEGYGTVSMEVETAPFDPANAQNRTYLGNGMYGYDFSAELVNGKYVITGYLDRGLLPKQAFEVAGKQSNMRIMAASGITAGLEFVKSTIEVAGNVEELTGAFGDLSKSARMAYLLNEYESIRPNIEPHLQEYYDRRISMMGEDIIMGKSLGFVQDGVAEAANLVPLAGQVVCGIAKYISGKLLGDMFDKEFESDYNILRSEFSNLPGSQNWYDRMAQSRWPTYNPETGLYSIPHRLEIRPHYIMDPSGYVYEAVEENRLSNVTATALFLPKEKAATAALAKASTEWQVWNA
jgi:chitodextrinase